MDYIYTCYIKLDYKEDLKDKFDGINPIIRIAICITAIVVYIYTVYTVYTCTYSRFHVLSIYIIYSIYIIVHYKNQTKYVNAK